MTNRESMKWFLLVAIVAVVGCKKEESTAPSTPTEAEQFFLRFDADPDQERLDNLGNPSVMAEGNAAQSPDMGKLSVHFIELVPDEFTAVGDGVILYQGEETTAGGEQAIDFQKAKLCAPEETFLTMNMDDLPIGEYSHIRVSLSYQEMDIDYRFGGVDLEGTLAGFLGYNSYITDFDINQATVAVNGNRVQGFWGFESLGQTTTGQAPEGATTVVNPLFDTAPIPAGSCLVSGAFDEPLIVDGHTGKELEMVLSFSTKDSFEWTEVIEDGKYEPDAWEFVVDMGVRGLKPSYAWIIVD